MCLYFSIYIAQFVVIDYKTFSNQKLQCIPPNYGITLPDLNQLGYQFCHFLREY